MKLPRARIIALAVSVGALASFATEPSALAAGAGPKPPLVGSNCQSDGKISGAGSSFQANAYYNALIYGYEQDICGPAAPASNLNASWGSTDPSIFNGTFKNGSVAVHGMVAYNYSLSGTAAKSGSGAGLNRISCRTDMFGGTDLPYNDTQLSQINGAPGLESGGSAPNYNCSTNLNLAAVPPPFGPPTTTYANASDAVANAMSFPITGGAVAFAINLNGMCTGAPPTGLNLTSAEVDGIWQGTINQWNDPALVATNPSLSTSGCSGTIQRVVRQDNSGTTGLTMQYLGGGDGGTRGIDTAASLCTNSVTNTANPSWLQAFQTSPNTSWPLNCKDGNGNVAPAPIHAATSGSPALISLLDTTNGGIGYAELGLWPSPLPAGVSFANLQNSTGTAFVSPGNPGAASACNPGVNGLPGSATPNESVGLGGVNDNWSNSGTSATTNRQNITYLGTGYPDCGLTFDLVYTGEHNQTGEVGGPSGTAGCTSNPTAVVSGTNTTADVGQTLPAATLTVNSTAGFPASGTLVVASSAGNQTVSYTGISGNSFTGASGGTGSVSAGAAVGLAVPLNSSTLPVGSTSTLPTAGVVEVTNAAGGFAYLKYAGKTATSLTGIPTTGPGSGSGNAANGFTAGLITGACQTVQGPEQGTTNDQLRTLYSFFTYVFSPLGQSYLDQATYDELPGSWLTPLRQGFQNNF